MQVGQDFHSYKIVEGLGHGAMGAVYRVRQTSTGRIAALKILAAEMARSLHFRRRFEREAKVMTTLTHPNIVTVYESGCEEETFYLFMECVEGTDLRRRLREEKRLPFPEARRILEQVCDGLAAAHARGIVHRDIKPENILIDRVGCVKLTDFGFAKRSDEEIKGHSLTPTGAAVGTVGYMSPEQMEDSPLVDERTDVYAAGVVLFEMLTGEIPLGASDRPSRRVSVEPWVDEVYARATARDLKHRIPSALELRRALTRS